MLNVDIFMSKYCFLCQIQKDLDLSFWSKPFRPFWVLWKLSIWINSWFFLCFLNLNEFSVSKIQLWLLPAFCCLRFCKTMTIQHFMGKKYICYLNVEKWIMCLKCNQRIISDTKLSTDNSKIYCLPIFYKKFLNVETVY